MLAGVVAGDMVTFQLSRETGTVRTLALTSTPSRVLLGWVRGSSFPLGFVGNLAYGAVGNQHLRHIYNLTRKLNTD